MMRKRSALQLIRTFPTFHGLLLVAVAGCWLTGILLSSWLTLPLTGVLTVAALGSGMVCILWRIPIARLAGLVLLCLCLGAWRYAAASPLHDAYAIHAFVGTNKVEVQATIVDEPRLEMNSTLLIVDSQQVSLDKGQSWREAHGEVQVQELGAALDNPYAPRYGDTIQFTGSLAPPPSYSTPEVQASMAFPILTITKRTGNPLLGALYQMRTILAGILTQALPQPLAALLIAIFLSFHTPSLKQLTPLFNVTGTAHLLAPSGFKVTLLSRLVNGGTGWMVPSHAPGDWQLLPAERRLGNWRRWLRTLLVVLCISGYTFLSGAGPAAIRAGVMGSLMAISPRLERSYNVYTALAATAILMSLIDPFVLWDTGFQLSFLGTLGIILLTPLFQRSLRPLTLLPLGHQLIEIIAVTMAAQVTTLPIFMSSFNQLSFIAPVANLVSVPLLSVLLVLGVLVGLAGLISLQLAILCGWLVWPLLWYMITVISWCAQLPGAYLQVSSLNPIVAWGYYVLLTWISLFLLTRWRRTPDRSPQQAAPLISQHTRRFFLCSIALLTIVATGMFMTIDQTDRHLTITLLTTDNPTQGEALFLRTPAGTTALIDEGADSVTLAQTLDTHLPFWERSLNLVVLADTSATNLAGLQDIITRYQVGHVIDAGMLHPSVAYARWRSILETRHLPYTQVRQGTLVSLDEHVSLQVLWPPIHLHKSRNETRDNALVLRLLAPDLSLLLLNATTLSSYALQALPVSPTAISLHAGIVQIVGEVGKSFPSALSPVLALVQPSLLLVTTLPVPKGKRNTAAPALSLPVPPAGSWQVLQGEQTGSLQFQSTEQGWTVNTAP